MNSNIKATRTNNTIRNILAGTGNRIISLLLPFATRTILIRRLGVDYLGVNSLFTSILQILSVTELGFSAAIIYSLYEPVAKNNLGEIRNKIALFRTIYKLVGTCILIVGLIVLLFLPKLIKGSFPSDINIYLAFSIFLTNTVVSYLAYGYKNTILVVYQRNDLISKADSIISIFRCVFQIIILAVCRNYYIYALTIPLTTLLSNFVINYLSNKLFPELNVKYKFSFAGLGEIKKQIGGIAIGRISLVCRNSFDSIILSSLFGLTMTAVYSNYYYVFSSVGSLIIVILTSMSASVGNSLVTESTEKNENDHRKFDFYYELLVGFCVICMYSLYQPFMRVWVGEDLMLPTLSMTLFCIYFYVNHLSQIRSVYSEAAGLWWHFKYLSIGEMAANLLLNVLLGKIWGINGILIATIITAFLCSFLGCTIITYKRLFKLSPLKYYFDNILYLVIIIFGCFVIDALCDLLPDGTWGTLILRGIMCAAVSAVYLCAAYSIIPSTKENLRGLKQLILTIVEEPFN